jgi:cell division cycle 14
LGWYSYKTFDVKDYEHYEKVENGDMNWIIPGKFLAFSGPSSKTTDPEGYRTFTPEDYVPIFKKRGITMVIRLNKKQYDREVNSNTHYIEIHQEESET